LKWEIPAEVCELDLKNGERSRRRVRDLVTQLAFEGRSQNETERARISMMARSDLLHARAGYRSARPITAILKIQLATRGRSIQLGQKRRSDRRDHFRFTPMSDNSPSATVRLSRISSCRPAITLHFVRNGKLVLSQRRACSALVASRIDPQAHLP
jgi:hypothetical protein